MTEEQISTSTEIPNPLKPDWLDKMAPQVEVMKIFNDIFESSCTCNACVRLRKALSNIKAPPTSTFGGQM